MASQLHTSILNTLTYNTGGPAYYVLHPQKGITICVFLTFLTRPSKTGKESFFRQILLSDLRFDTCVVLFYFNHNLVICFSKWKYVFRKW